jgi:hypothetical protein
MPSQYVYLIVALYSNAECCHGANPGAQRMNLKLFLSRLTVLFAILALASCVVYEPMPYGMPSRFDQSWAAASGAIVDAGLTITTQDRNTGVIRGQRGDSVVTVMLETLPDGRVQVKFNGDSALIQRVSDNYERRMGR